MNPDEIARMEEAAERASQMMKTLGHSGRLMILCNLAEGERSVGELADELEMSQSSLSQHFARMRNEGLVKSRRESQTVFYSLASEELQQVIEALYRIFCPKKEGE